ncbi:ribonuclease H-like domain-containing protein [Rhizophagus clarus]|uniref:Ribonuclease H-like domain-containing protein n=1 Tax=Rhizophagus clarus TaxID=94130 RepID=A0A8H3M0G8_9GLOM|nr:ribonuclease H-like domain-containing protein [Rhizophagus clarus]
MHTPTNFDQTDRSRTLTCYNGACPLVGIPSCNDIVAEFDNGMTAILQQSLSDKQPIHFMSTEVSDDIEGYSFYILYVEVPKNHSSSSLKTILARILLITLKNTTKFGFENIRAFPLQGYHIEKKVYICYYYRKVVREERLPLSSWAVLSNYLCEFTPDGTYLFQLSVDNYNPISEEDYNNPLFSSALTRDQILILTWDIETYSSRKTGEVPNAKYDEDKVFIICMTVYWKDDPKSLKQICLVDVKTAPESGWITIVSEKSSLAFYLNECGLESKMDMPIHHMNKYYERRLMVKYNAINEYREVASVAFLSLFDAHYFAGGMKVCNLLSASIWQRGILTSMISRQQTETRKYPGAHVFPPVKGLKNRRLHNNISEEKGLYTIVLEYLSGKRNEMKKRLAPLKEKNEDIDLVISLMEKHEFIAEYDSICFDCFYLLDAKQYALKVYMNIFYGTAGNICPEERFQRCDEAYDISNGISKEEYWSQMVKISMVEMEKLCDKVNVFLKEDNGSSYLKMAYEEVLFLGIYIDG